MGVIEDFKVQYDRVRAMTGIIPPSSSIVIGTNPPNGDAYEQVINGIIHVDLNPFYVPTAPLTVEHRYIHETYHVLEMVMRMMFAVQQNYLYTRVHAFRFKGSPIVPATWQEAQAYANSGGTYKWAYDPVERWAELGVIATMGYVEKERTSDYGQPLDIPGCRRLFMDLVHEIQPVIYPTLYGGQPIAKGPDNEIFFYHRPADDAIVTFGWDFSLLGATKKWW